MKKIEANLLSECASLLCDFAREVTEAWKGWLTGSLPMTALAIAALVDPDWIRLPVWAWTLAIFVAGLVVATFRVYRDLRKERDDLRQLLARSGVRGLFVLVPLGDHASSVCQTIEEVRSDL